MAIDRSALSGLDPEGFALAERLRVYARRGEAEFVTLYPAPALIVETTTPDATQAAQESGDRERSFARTHAGEVEADVRPAHPSEVARYVGRVAFLTKRPGNLFPEMVTVGRALNNDITLVVGSVSKVHGYFREEPGRWSFTDQRSTNGTCWNGRRLDVGEKVLLEDGDRLQFGPDVACTFVLAPSLCRRLAGPPIPS